ncbi:MAG TPA: hypothetical protein VIX80_08310 [Candidatus Kapabacteria bacterium]
MKKKTTERRVKAAVAATLMAMPMLSSPGVSYGQKGTPAPQTKAAYEGYLKFSDSFHKHKGDLWIAGVGDGHTIYEKPNGEMFYIDTKTGDMKEVSSKVFMKHTPDAKSVEGGYIKQETYIKFDGVKGESKVKLLGVDAKGNVVHQKPNGEKFIVDEATGHVTVLK